jgi:hypothetical protein
VCAIAIASTPRYIGQTLKDAGDVSIGHDIAPTARSAAILEFHLQVKANLDMLRTKVSITVDRNGELGELELLYIRICA